MNILLTSVGRRSYVVHYFQSALQGQGLVHAANSIETYAMTLADRWVRTPLIYEECYVSFLLDYCLKNSIGAIVPLFDVDLPILSLHKERFKAAGIVVVVSDYAVTTLCNDKWKSHEFLRAHGFCTPRTYLSLQDCLHALQYGELFFPLVVKPRWGMGSIAIYTVDTIEELNVLYKKVRGEIFHSYLKYESSKDTENGIVIQEKICGIECGLDVFNDLEMNFHACVPKQKLAMRAGETDSAITIENPVLFEIGKRLAATLKHVGNLDVDCFWENNRCCILELNCRFGGQYPFSHLAGADFPKALVQQLNGERVDPACFKARIGVRGVKDLLPAIYS